MIKITADYHTHTRFSHGVGDMEDNVKEAIAKGLKRIAISDHGYGHIGFGIQKSDLPIMHEKKMILKERYPEIEILLGLEANILSPEGELDVDDSDLEYIDILLAGYHFGSMPKGWSGVVYHGYNFLSRWKIGHRKAKELNTQAFCNAMKRYPVKILTHPGAKGPVDIHAVAQTAVEQDVWLEINTNHGYLTVPQIETAKKIGATFVISSDAHRPQDVGGVEAAIMRAVQAGLTATDIANAIEE